MKRILRLWDGFFPLFTRKSNQRWVFLYENIKNLALSETGRGDDKVEEEEKTEEE